MRRLNTCLWCGNKYDPVRSVQMYCSKSCRLKQYKNMRPDPKDKEMFVLVITTTYIDDSKAITELYKGKTYANNGEYYPCTTNDLSEVKKYASKKTAENACVKLNEITGGTFEVISFDDINKITNDCGEGEMYFMDNLDVAGVLRTYSEKCAKARDNEQLKDIVRELKKELNSEEIKKLRVLSDS